MFASILSPKIVRLAIPVAIVVLPLIGFTADRFVGEEIVARAAGPSLYALYVLGLVAYAVISYARSPGLLTVSAGVLGVAAAASALVGMLGFIGSFYIAILIFMAPLLAPFILVVIAIGLSPWVTAWALGKTSLSALRSSRASASRFFILAGAIVGVCIAVAVMVFAAKADAGWLAVRQKAFDSDDVRSWEQSLRDIKANPLCGHRRCLMKVCSQLMNRFELGSGECEPFACSDLDRLFQAVYGHSAQQICSSD